MRRQGGIVVGIQRRTEAQRDLTRGIGRRALRGILQEGIRITLTQHLMQELDRIDDARVGNHRHSLLLTHTGDQVDQFLVLHLCADLGIAQHAAKHAKRGVHRVHAGADLHQSRFFDDIAPRQDNAALFERRMSIRERIFNQQIVHILRVNINCSNRSLPGNKRARVFQPVRFQLFGNALIRVRGDLVDHGKRIGILFDQIEILIFCNEFLLLPGSRHIAHRALQAGTVIRAVIQRNQRERRQSRAAARQAERRQLAEERSAAFRTVRLVVCIVRDNLMCVVLECIALLGQSEADHLERRRKEYLLQARHIFAHFDALRDRSDNLFVDRAVGIHGYYKGEMVARTVAAVDQFLVIPVAADHTGICQARSQHALRQHGGKSPEQVTCTEVQPGRRFTRVLAYRVNIILRQAVSLPGRIMFDALFCQFHKAVTPFQRTERAVLLQSYIVYQKILRLHRENRKT